MNWKVIEPEVESAIPPWKFPTLYKKAANGGIMVWEIGFDGINLVTNYHYEGGKSRDPIKVAVKTNKSGRSLSEQALLEARHKYSLKMKKGFTRTKEGSTKGINLMKGVTYDVKRIKHWPVLVQPKLDGIRLYLKLENEVVTAYTYNNNRYDHLDHLTSSIREFFRFLPPGTILDGELYRHGWSFQQISSVVKRLKTLHPDLNQIEYHVFDYYNEEYNVPVEKRMELLYNAYEQYNGRNQLPFTIVESEYAYNTEEIEKYHHEAVSNGYEGLMIKLIGSPFSPKSKEYQNSLYKLGRTTNIMKLKDFTDEEAIVIGVKSGRGTEEDTAILIVRDTRGNDFPARPCGSFEIRREWLENPDKIIGREVTIRFEGRTDEGKPRFPRVTRVRPSGH